MLYKQKFISIHKNNYRNFLAFNTYQVYTSMSNNQKIKIKRIYLRDCNNNIMDKVVLKNIKLKLNILYNIHNHKTYVRYINKFIQKLKSSGYISSIKIFNINNQDYKYITLNVKINPTIKKITILNYKRLKIPSRFLKGVFKKQIGMPKNYKLINDSLRLIYLWYKSRGFTWVNINLIEQKKLDPNTISFQIMEGIVQDVKLICRTKNIDNPNLVNLLDLLIKKELDIYTDSILNIKKIEEGIKYLTSLNLIKDCNYIIKRNKEKLIILIKYNISKNYIAYFYNYNSNLEKYPNYQQVYDLLNKCLNKFKFFSRYILYIQKFHIYSSIIQVDQYLGFIYRSFYAKNNINNIFIHLAVSQDYPQLRINFLHPYVYKQKKILGHTAITLYNRMIKHCLCYPFLLLKFDGLNSSQKSNLSTYLYNIICLLKHKVFKKTQITERVWAVYNKYKKINIYIKDYKLNQTRIKEKLIESKIFNITKLLKYIRYKLIHLQISIIYNNLNFEDQLKTGKLLKIQSRLFTYITRNYHNNYTKLVYLGQNIGIKYIQVFNLPKFLTYIYYNTLIIFLECHFSVNSQTCTPILYNSYSIKKHIYFKGNYNKNFPLYFFHIFNLEYHISKFKHFSIYFFGNYSAYSYNQKQHKLYIEDINRIYYEMNIGSGIKFYIPIKKLPNIRLEYSIDNKSEHSLGLSTDLKYNE